MMRALFPLALLVALAGCASARVTTPAIQDIDAILAGGGLDGETPPTFPAKIKAVLQKARGEIVASETARQAAEKRAAKSEVWASRGKWLAGGCAVGGCLLLLGIGSGIVRRFIG